MGPEHCFLVPAARDISAAPMRYVETRYACGTICSASGTLLMMEESHSRKRHNHIVFIRRFDYKIVTDRAAGLGNVADTALRRIARPKVARGEGAKISPKGKILLLPNCRRGVASLKRRGRASFACGVAFGKLQLLLVGSRLHFPSENRKSYSPLKGRFYSFQTVDGASPV